MSFYKNVFIIDLAERSLPYDRKLYYALLNKVDSVKLFTRNHDYNDSWRYLKFFNLNFYEFNLILKKSLKFFEVFINSISLYIWLFFQKSSIIHFQWLPLLEKINIDFVFLRLLKFKKHKIIYTVHNVLPHDTEKKYFSRYKKLYHLSDYLIVHSENVKEELIRDFHVNSSKINVIPHGDLVYDRPLPFIENVSESSSCLFFGLIKPYKGIEFLLDAWYLIESEKKINFKLTIAGKCDPYYFNFLKEKIRSLNLKNVTFINSYLEDADLIELISNHDLILYPYKQITTSGALALGLASGKPLLVTSLPTFRSVLDELPEDFFVSFGDTFELSKKIIKILQDKSLQKIGGQLSYECSVKRFNWDNIANLTLNLYSKE